MRFRDQEIPAALVQVYLDALEALSKGRLMAAVRALPEGVQSSILRGFRPAAAPHGPVRQRLLQMVRGGFLDEEMCDFLRGLLLPSPAPLASLDEDTLVSCLPALLGLLPPAWLLAALLLDSRSRVQDLAWEILQDPERCPRECAPFSPSPEAGQPPPEDAPGELSSPTPSLSPSPSPSPDQERSRRKLERQLRDLEQDLRRQASAARKLDRKLQGAREERDRAQQERREAEERLGDLESRCTRLQQDLTTRERELRDLEARLEQAVAEGVREGLAARRRLWLVAPRETAPVPLAPGADLLEAVEETLERQAQEDRHAGHRRQLEERRGALVKALGRVQEARAQSLRPLPELLPLSTRLGEEIEEITRRLGTGPGENKASPLGELAARLNEAESGEALAHLHDLVASLEEARALTASQARELYQVHERVMTRLYEAHPESRPVAEDQSPSWVLRCALDGMPAPGGQGLLVLLDGHNLLYGLPHLFGPHYDPDGHPRRRAREALVESLRGLVRERCLAEFRVFLDSAERSEVDHGPHLKEIFSGGGEGDQRADQAMLRYLEFHRLEFPDTPSLLVTDDRELTARARELGARSLRLQHFATLLGEEG